MDKITGFFKSIATKEGIISIAAVLVVCLVLRVYSKKKSQGSLLSTKDVVAIGIGAALYGVISMIPIPIGPNTSFRIAIAILVIFGGLFGPIVGFLVGFIGHALNDALMWGSVWWSWVFLSAVIGLFSGLINLDDKYDISAGMLNKAHIIRMYIYSVAGVVIGSLVAYLGDVFLYGEPADKVWLQIILSSVTNLAVIAVIGIPVLIGLAKRNKTVDLEKEEIGGQNE